MCVVCLKGNAVRITQLVSVLKIIVSVFSNSFRIIPSYMFLKTLRFGLCWVVVIRASNYTILKSDIFGYHRRLIYSVLGQQWMVGAANLRTHGKLWVFYHKSLNRVESKVSISRAGYASWGLNLSSV